MTPHTFFVPFHFVFLDSPEVAVLNWAPCEPLAPRRGVWSQSEEWLVFFSSVSSVAQIIIWCYYMLLWIQSLGRARLSLCGYASDKHEHVAMNQYHWVSFMALRCFEYKLWITARSLTTVALAFAVGLRWVQGVKTGPSEEEGLRGDEECTGPKQMKCRLCHMVCSSILGCGKAKLNIAAVPGISQSSKYVKSFVQKSHHLW